ncbi:MAG: 3-deoxy-8-phosphooctulonate synthase, partial [Thermodesulfobacteriota bacterium]
MNKIEVSGITLGGTHLALIAGPCVIEDYASTVCLAERLKEITDSLDMPFIFKASYDKANRTSINSYRGPGLEEGLEILKDVKEKFKVPVLTDVHCQTEVGRVAEVVDILQIPAYLSRQTALITSAAETNKVINIKKGPFLAPWDIKGAIDKVLSTKNDKIIITERGTTFGYNNLVVDMRSMPIIRAMGYPVVFDATHSV